MLAHGVGEGDILEDDLSWLWLCMCVGDGGIKEMIDRCLVKK